jgi:NAD(P)-dependent dehydrogenase (short-subunit alcohol dehydrogenase family)
LTEKVAIVTGSASGIGKAIAQRFASEGAFVIIADKNEGAIPPAVDEIKAAGGAAAGFPIDVADRAQVQAFMTKAAYGRVDILVNNAGITRYRPFLTMSDEDWNLVLDVDLKGVFFCVQAAAPQMIRQAYGKIVNISSALGTGTTPHNTAGSPAGSSAYASAKAGVIQLTKTWRASSAPRHKCELRRTRHVSNAADRSDAYAGASGRAHRVQNEDGRVKSPGLSPRTR